MPFTPFHMGPALALKPAAREYFSLTVFGISQVLIDIEPLVQILRNAYPLHGYTHTLLGAALLAPLAALIGRPLGSLLVRMWNRQLRALNLAWLTTPDAIDWKCALISAAVGTFSHLWFDGLTHMDMRPFWPLLSHNPLLSDRTEPDVMKGCAVFGVVGAMVWVARRWSEHRRALYK